MKKSVARPKRLTIGHIAIAAAIASAAYAYKTVYSDPGTTFVGTAADTGELDTSRLPRISGASETYASAATTILVSPEDVSRTAEQTIELLAAEGWQRYDAPFSEKAAIPNLEILTFKKDTLGLNAFITVAPAQGNKTNVTYTAIPLKFDLPFPEGATEIQFDPERPHLSCVVSQDVQTSMAFFTTELTERSWSAWSVKDQAKVPEATQATDHGAFSYFVRDGHRPMIVIIQRHQDGTTHAKVEVVPDSLLKPKQEETASEPAPAAPAANPAGEKINEAFNDLTKEILNQARQATKDAIGDINGAASPQPASPPAPVTPPTALRDVTAPIPLPKTADSVEFDSENGNVDFLSSSTVRALAAFYRSEMKTAGWEEQPTVIDRDNMAVLRFSIGGKDVSITIMQMGKTAKVSASGSGLAKAAEASPPAVQAAATADGEKQLSIADLEIQDIAGLPVPTPNSLNGSEKSLYRLQVNARVPANVETVLAFYRRELGKRSDWKETPGSVVQPGRAAIGYETSAGPAALTLTNENGDTTVALVVRKQAEAANAGMLPKPGNVKLLFGNVLDGEASVTIANKTVRIGAGVGGKRSDGPTLEIPPGKHTFSFKLPGATSRTDEIEVTEGDVWGLMIGPGGVLALQMY